MAAELVVDDDGLQCPEATFPTIQSAVDAANAGDTVRVCEGTYVEQVTVQGAAKDGLTLVSDEPDAARIEFVAIRKNVVTTTTTTSR